MIARDIPVEEFFKHENGCLQEHWDQLAGNKDKIKLKPDVSKYKLLQDAGVLKNVVVIKDGNIIGYSVFFVQPHLHYIDDLYAFVDVVFVKEEYRNSRAGLSLINETEKYCKELNVSVLQYHTKPAHNTIEKILYAKKYKHMENIIGKLLKE